MAYIVQHLNRINSVMWSLVAKSLGNEHVHNDTEKNQVYFIRAAIVIFYVVTNIIVIANVIHHW